MKRYITLFLLFILCGCATTAANQAKVRIDDGLNAWEAKVIAQTDLNNSQFKEAYSWPKVLNNGMTDVHPEYWFVSFGASDVERSFWSYLVVINKANGGIKFSGPYVPMRIFDFNWVFGEKSS